MAELLSPIASTNVSAGLSYSEKNQIKAELEDKKAKGKEGWETRRKKQGKAGREQMQTEQN